jgi:hypothetical protein
MRRPAVALVVAVWAATFAAVSGAPARAAVEEGCAPHDNGYRCHYGPIVVRKGEPAITPFADIVDAVPEAGYVTALRATLVDTAGNAVPRHAVHLHHAVWLNPTKGDSTCGGLPDRFFASGKERTKIELPDGFGYHWSNTPPPPPYSYLASKWLLNYHLDAMHKGRYEVFLRLDVDFIADSAATDVTDVTPMWFDVDNCNDSEFNVPKNGGVNGKYKATWDYQMPTSGRFVAMAGHLHDGGLKIKLRNRTSGTNVFTSKPTYAKHDKWDLRKMSAFSDPMGPRVAAEDELRLVAVYDDSRKWRDVMGIMIGAFVPDAP